MTTLAQTVANAITSELSGVIFPEEAAERKRDARIRELNETGARFFAKAQQYFTDGIMSAVPMDSLYLQVGGQGYKEADDYHEEVRAELDWHDVNGRRTWNTEGKVPTSMTDPDRFAASWEDFKGWATAKELEAYWELGRGGVGGWWYLRIQPLASTAA